MHCPDCHKFVSFDTDGDPDINVDVNGGSVTGDARITNNCAECSTELKEASFYIDEEIPLEDHADCDGELSVDVEDAERTDRMDNKTSTGQLIKNVRYMKHLYGAQATFKVTCSKCEFDAEIPWSDETSGSSMDELT